MDHLLHFADEETLLSLKRSLGNLDGSLPLVIVWVFVQFLL